MDTQSALVKAIDQVVADFQAAPGKGWNERELHWCLFHHLKHNGDIPEDYPTQLIRAEFPTWEYRDKVRRTRGRYDLVILDRESVAGDKVKNMDFNTEWDEWLPFVTILAAVEIKLWLTEPLGSRPAKDIEWDVDKLTHIRDKQSEARVQSGYYLNFIQMDFEGAGAHRCVNHLEERLANWKAKHPSLNILCVAGGPSAPPMARWL